MTNEEVEQRITAFAGHVNRASDVVRDAEDSGALEPPDAGAIYTGLAAATLLIDQLREARKDSARLAVLRSNYIGANLDCDVGGATNEVVLLFVMPKGAIVSANLDATIDALLT